MTSVEPNHTSSLKKMDWDECGEVFLNFVVILKTTKICVCSCLFDISKFFSQEKP